MKNVLKNLYRNTAIGRLFLRPIRETYNYYRMHIKSEKKILKEKYFLKFNRELDLDNPKTLNEKLQWLKLNERSAIYTTCADKYRVRDYVKEKIGEEYLIPLIIATKNPENVAFESLPNAFVVKANHSSGKCDIVWDKNKLDWSVSVEKYKDWLRENYFYGKKEWQYKNIEPHIVIEELLLDEKGQIPPDYKLHCINGKVEFVRVTLDRETNYRVNFYSPRWKPLLFTWSSYVAGKPKAIRGREVSAPPNLNRMIEIAELLAKDFSFVRVDLYCMTDKIYFGELTFTPGSGFEKFSPERWDKEFGSKLVLPSIVKTN